MNKDRVIRELNLIPFGSKGWMRSDKCNCHFGCGESDKFGILFIDNGGVVKCMRCTQSTSIFKYLIHIGRDDLIERGYKIESIKPKLEDLKSEDEETEYEEPEEKKMPVGFKRMYFDEYLDDRGFTPIQYKLYEVGKTEKDFRLKNYIIITIKQKGKIVAWLARSKRTKEWHKDNLKKYKETKGTKYETGLILRYRNSEKTDFEKILGGVDEITDKTKTIWLVEGFFDKTNLDNLYNLHNQEEIKCCYTFGNSISKFQTNLLREYPNIEDIVMLYDFGTTNEVKRFGSILNKYWEVLVGEFKDKDIDAGDADIKYMNKILSNLKNFHYFYKNRL